jgi:Protein of unknown function (DUF2934)
MSFAVADLQKQREEIRARLLANEEIRRRIAFRAYEIYQRRGDGHGGALNNWLQAEDEVVSSLVEQEFKLLSVSTGRKGLKGNPGESPKLKPAKKSQSRAASVSDTASKRKAKTKQAAPTSAKTVKGDMNTGGPAKKPSDARTRRKERSESEGRPA